MAGQTQGRSARHRRHRLMSEINVVPFIDVMLILLVVFMVTAPLLTVGVEVNLPESEAGAITGDDEPLEVTIKEDGEIFIQETPIALDHLVPRLRAIIENRSDKRIFVRGDEDIDYGRVMIVMGRINAAGFKKIGLITLPGVIEEE